MTKTFIVIPAVNEGETIGQMLKSINSTIKKHKLKNVKIIIIDDGSQDNTVVSASKFDNVLIYSHKVNMGLGAAVRNGLSISKQLGGDYVVKIDADCQHDPEDIIKILNQLKTNEVDIVYGRRILNFRTSLIRMLGNLFFSWLMKKMTSWDIQDSQPGIFGINKSCLSCIRIFGSYNYTQQVLLSSKEQGMRFRQVEVSFSKRTSGQSFVTLKYLHRALLQILMLMVCFKPLKYFGRFGLLCLFLGATIFLYQFAFYLNGSAEKVVSSVNLILGLSIVGSQSLAAGIVAQLVVNLNNEKQIDQRVFEEFSLKKNNSIHPE